MIARDQRAFGDGAFDDIPPSKIPANGMKWLENYIAFNDRLEPRGGSKKWAAYQLPKFYSGLTTSKTGATVTVTGAITYAYAGCQIHYDDGTYDLILVVAGGTLTVDASTTRPASTAAFITEPVFGFWHHVGKNLLVLHIGNKLYAANYNFTANATYGLAAGWNRVYGLSANIRSGSETDPDRSNLQKQISDAAEYNDYMVIFNGGGWNYFNSSGEAIKAVGGIYVIRFVSPLMFYPINTPVPSQRLTDNSVKSETNKYGYRYLYTMSKMRTTAVIGDRTSAGSVMELESGSTEVNASDYKDYGEIWSANPTGPATAAEKYPVWTGNALPAAFDTIAENAVIADAQFKITVSSTAYLIRTILTGVTSWNEIADAFQVSCRDFLPEMEVAYSAAGRFVFTHRVKGARITAFAAGDGGTDISSMFATGAEVLTNWDSPLALATASYKLKNPENYVSAGYWKYDHWTHYSIYRTLDIGVNGIDPITGQGNNSELYVWVADRRVIKSFKCSVSSYVVTATADTFLPEDVGDVIVFSNGDEGTIVSYTSATIVVVGATVGNRTNVAAAIGSAFHPQLAYKSGTTLTALASSFEEADIGKAIFWQDGTIDIITGYTSETVVTVAASGTISSVGAGGEAISIEPEERNFYDRTSDDILRTRVAYFSLKNRFWESLPNFETGIIGNGFMFGAVRDQGISAYCQVAEEFWYLWGYHNASKQVIQYKDNITAIKYQSDNAVVICYNSIHRAPLNNYIEEKVESVGEVVFVLTGTAPISPNIGCQDIGAIRIIDNYTIGMISSDNQLILIQFDGASFKLSGDMAKDRFRKRLRANVGVSTLSYDKLSGLLMWIKTASWLGRTALTTKLSSEKTDKSYRFGIISDEQGVGVSENTGASWVLPFSGVAGVVLNDAQNQPRHIILDRDGYCYDLTSREGATDSGIARLAHDKAATDASGGTDIAPAVWFPLDEGNRKRYYLQSKNCRVFLEPFDRSKANATGYTAEGYPDTLEVDLTLFQDGDISTVKARAKDINFSGDISYDRFARAHGLQLKVSATTGEHIITGRLQEYEAEDKAEDPDSNTDTQMVHQGDIQNCDFHLFSRNGAVINRVLGQAPSTLPAVTLVSSPEGGTNGIEVDAGTIEDTNKTLSYTGDFSVQIGVKDVDATGIYFYIGTGFSIRVYLDGATYKCAVLYNSATTTASLSYAGSGWCNITVSRSGTTLSITEAL
jgi:hypothetical protein